MNSPSSILSQISTLAQLQDGWFDGHGTAYDPRFLHYVTGELRELLDRHGIPTPFIYPTEFGEVRLEWNEVSGCSVVIEVWPVPNEFYENMSVLIVDEEGRSLSLTCELSNDGTWKLIRSYLVTG